MLCRLRAALTFTVVLLSISALAQEPSKGPVRLLVGFAPGGSSDLAARIIADKLKDVLGAPVMHVANYQLALSAGSNPPAKTLAELTTWLKANPSKASFGSPAPGSLPHFFGLMVGRSIGVDIQHIAYKGGAPLHTDLIGGQVPVAIDALSDCIEQHRGA